jgi:hypothetical protein
MAMPLSRSSFLGAAAGMVSIRLGVRIAASEPKHPCRSASPNFLQALTGWWLQNNLSMTNQ